MDEVMEDEVMDEGVMEVFEVVEVDFEYEYDAARFFDFTRPETQAETRLSESWFDSATSYPPSPFVAKLFPTEDLYSEDVDASPKSKYDYNGSLVDGDIDAAQEECCYRDEVYRDEEERGQNATSCRLPSAQYHAEGLLAGSSRGFLFYNHMADAVKKTKDKSFAKPSLPRSSTLMKPTASQLAKQHQRRQACNSRFQKNEVKSSVHTAAESQASKRQKLDGGLLRKIDEVKQPINLIHKVPKKDFTVQGITSKTKLRITIPREPELETAHRAERIRPTSIKRAENPTRTTSRFKAQPLNRKILEPQVMPIPKRGTLHLPEFQVFDRKTTERVKHHAPTVTPTSTSQIVKGFDKSSHNRILQTGNRDGKRCDGMDAQKMTVCQPVHSFKARPLDRKILASRGDIGVFRNNKRDVTVPKEFQFQTAKRSQQYPPIDLFSKLSLAGEPQPKSCVQLEFSQRASIPSKPSKENRWKEPCGQSQYVKQQEKERSDIHCVNQIQSVANRELGEIAPRSSIRPFGIWRQQ